MRPKRGDEKGKSSGSYAESSLRRKKERKQNHEGKILFEADASEAVILLFYFKAENRE